MTPRASVSCVMLQRVPPEIRIFTPALVFFSKSSVRFPRSAARIAAINPAAPAPAMTTSYTSFVVILDPSDETAGSPRRLGETRRERQREPPRHQGHQEDKSKSQNHADSQARRRKWKDESLLSLPSSLGALGVLVVPP